MVDEHKPYLQDAREAHSLVLGGLSQVECARDVGRPAVILATCNSRASGWSLAHHDHSELTLPAVNVKIPGRPRLTGGCRWKRNPLQDDVMTTAPELVGQT